MKIRVQRCDGRIEIITLEGDSIHISPGEFQNCLETYRLDHYFTPDGYYDGWGLDVSEIPVNGALPLIEKVEAKRQIEGEEVDPNG